MVANDPYVDPVAARYGCKVRAARAHLALSQKQFAERVGDVSVRTVRAWEKGKHTPQGKHRILLQRIFDQVDAEDEQQRAAIGI